MLNYHAIVPTPIGNLGLVFEDEKLVSLEFVSADVVLHPNAKYPAWVASIVKHLDAYFAKAKPLAQLPLMMHGTPFQKKVWHHLNQIPFGQTVTYGELAAKLQTSPRAVGGACRNNPVPIIVPCHRVVAANHIGGYSGHTAGEVLARKEWLLAHESKT